MICLLRRYAPARFYTNFSPWSCSRKLNRHADREPAATSHVYPPQSHEVSSGPAREVIQDRGSAYLEDSILPDTAIGGHQPSLHYRDSGPYVHGGAHRSQYDHESSNADTTEPPDTQRGRNPVTNGFATVNYDDRSWSEASVPIDPTLTQNSKLSSTMAFSAFVY